MALIWFGKLAHNLHYTPSTNQGPRWIRFAGLEQIGENGVANTSPFQH
jgi:hypothetical protein